MYYSAGANYVAESLRREKALDTMMQRVRISPLVAGDAADAAQPQATSAAVGIAEKLRLEAEVKHHRLLAVLQGLPTPIKQKHAVGFFSIIESKSRSQQEKTGAS